MRVAEILTRKEGGLVTVRPDCPVRDAVVILATNNIGTVLVTDPRGGLAGILSERDVIRALSRREDHQLDNPVSGLMTASVITCTAENTIDDALSLMGMHHIRHLPVVRDEKIVGLLSIRDVLEFRLQMIEEHFRALTHAEQEASKARVEAELSNRAKTEFLANVSHELKTPLNAIIGFAELLTSKPLAREHLEYLLDIAKSGRHLLEIVDNLLDLSRIDIKELEPREEILSIPTLISTCIHVVSERAERNGVRLRVDGDAPLPMLSADARMTKQMLTNLLSNAVKFTPEGGEVSIGAARNVDDGLCVRVSDTGIGIAPEHLTRVLEPFHQADSSLSRCYEGVGLGLTLVNAMIQAHGGALSLESEVGTGTVATLSFPSERIVAPAWAAH
jgi:signal transduction histidine kinase